jgi:MerR family transcriptional regulator, thiopeptide resistance regulator
MEERVMQLKVGELAERSGISVRTLHHYDEIGLLAPSQRSSSGHRLYTDADVLRLQQIISLRSLGFSLFEIGDFLKSPAGSPLQILEMHLLKLQQEAAERRKLIASVERIASSLASGQNPTVEELLNLIEGITMFEKYYSPEQLASLQERRALLGEEKIRQTENEWLVLIEEVKAEKERGADPGSCKMQNLARRWQELLALFTGGDSGIATACKTMYKQEGPEKASRGMISPEIFAYMQETIARLPQKGETS